MSSAIAVNLLFHFVAGVEAPVIHEPRSATAEGHLVAPHAEKHWLAASADAGAPADAPADDPYQRAVAGLYPLWDNTGVVLPHRRMYMTTSSMQFGILDRLQIGLDPLALVMRVPNLQAKTTVVRRERVSVALQAGGYFILPGAHDRFFSSRYSSGIAAFDTTIVALPATLAASWRVTPWLTLHPSVTALVVTGRAPVLTEVTPGAFVTAELLAHAFHGVYLHGGQIGIERGGLQIFGASYRLRWGWFETRVGYFYRRNQDGMQSQPLYTLGALL